MGAVSAQDLAERSRVALSIPSQRLPIRPLRIEEIGPASTMMGLAASWNAELNFQFGLSRQARRNSDVRRAAIKAAEALVQILV